MTCKECKGSGKYQPLIGLPELCRACSLISELRPINKLNVPIVIAAGVIHLVLGILLVTKVIPCKIHINENNKVIHGSATVLALRQLQHTHPKLYTKLVPNGMVAVLNHRDYESEEL